MNKKFYKIALLASIMIGTVACGGEDKSDEGKSKTQKEVGPNDNDTTALDAEPEDLEEYADNDVQLPTALQVAQMMNKEGLDYTEGLAHDPDKADSYSTQLQKKLVFGVYSADLAYCVLNDKFTEAQSYMTVVRDLGSETGLAKIFDSEDLLKSFEENMSDREGLMDVLVDINWRTEEIFDTDPESKKQSMVHFAGAWIEGMYLGSQIVVENKNYELGTTLVEQMNILSSLIKGLKTIEQDGLDKLIVKLEDILNTYNSFESVKANAASENGTFTLPTLSADEVNKLAQKISDLRESIVNA